MSSSALYTLEHTCKYRYVHTNTNNNKWVGLQSMCFASDNQENIVFNIASKSSPTSSNGGQHSHEQNTPGQDRKVPFQTLTTQAVILAQAGLC